MIDRPSDKIYNEPGASRDERAAACEAALQERFREIAYLTSLLREREQLDQPQRQEVEWLCNLAVALIQSPPWWGLLPRSLRRRRLASALRQSGLFDAEDYLRRNPDVAATGADPLRHYLQHGVREGRSRSA